MSSSGLFETFHVKQVSKDRELLTMGNYQKAPHMFPVDEKKKDKQKHGGLFEMICPEINNFFLKNLDIRFTLPQSGCQPAFLLDSSS